MRTLLSPAQRSALFDPPDDRPTVERLYTLGPDDLAETARRRRGDEDEGETPVGLGSHVPAFLLRPAVVKSSK